MDSTNLLIGVGVCVAIIIAVLACRKKEGLQDTEATPFINPQHMYSALQGAQTSRKLPNDAPAQWQGAVKPLQQLAPTELTDPGTHLQCSSLCKQRSKGGDADFLRVCTDTCIQERWTSKDAPLKQFKP